MINRKRMAIACAALMMISLYGCGSGQESFSSAGSVVESSSSEKAQNTVSGGKITAIDGNTVTVALGTMPDMSKMGDGQGQPAGKGDMQPGSKAEESSDNSDTQNSSVTEEASGSNDSQNSSSSEEASSGDDTQDKADQGSTPPEKPSGDSKDQGSTPPEKPSGDGKDQGSTPPEKPSGDSKDQGSTPPEKPSGDSKDQGSTPSEKPSGDNKNQGEQSSDNNAPQGSNIPEMPSGGDGQQGSDIPEMPDGDSNQGKGDFFTESGETKELDLTDVTITKGSGDAAETIAVSDLSVGDILTWDMDSEDITKVTVVDAGGMGQPGQGGGMGQPGQGGSGSGEVSQGSAATTLDEDGTYENTVYTSTDDDENALRVDGASVTLDGITVEKSDGASSNVENGDFYGTNAGLLATDGADVTITNATVNTSAQNGNGIFSYGEGTTVNVSDTKITTTADNSGGIQTTGGATTNAENLTVETSGASSAAIRSDRGGGTVTVKGGSYVSKGLNSPAVYSTADITVSDAELRAEGSEALVIEGKNSLKLTDCEVSGNMSDTEGSSSDENVHNIMIYQSMSGDADEGTATFEMTGGTLRGMNGDMFYVTNTDSEIKLSGVTVDQEDEDAALFKIVGNSASKGWGTAGKNGGQAKVTLDDMDVSGDIIVDSISTLDLTISGNTTFEGTVNIVDNEDGGDDVDDNAVITIESGSTWKLTGDCTASSVVNNGKIDYNGYTITLEDGTVMK